MCVVGHLSEDGNISHISGSQMRGPTKCHFGRRVLSSHDQEKCGLWRSRPDFKLYLKLCNLLVLTVYCGHDPCPIYMQTDGEQINNKHIWKILSGKIWARCCLTVYMSCSCSVCTHSHCCHPLPCHCECTVYGVGMIYL